MSSQNKIKSITPTVCPHCKADIFVEYSILPPTMESVYTPVDVAKAKADAISRIEVLAIDDEKKVDTLKWINDENTVFGPMEVDSIINSLLSTNE